MSGFVVREVRQLDPDEQDTVREHAGMERRPNAAESDADRDGKEVEQE